MLVDIHLHTGMDAMGKEFGEAFYMPVYHCTPEEHGIRDTLFLGTPEETVEVCERAGLDKAFLLASDFERLWNLPPSTHDHVAEIIKLRPNLFVGIASVDPLGGSVEKNLQEIERAVTELGFKGLKLYPAYQGFSANDERLFPYYEKCIELDVPVILHQGFTPMGCSFELANPIYADEVGIRYPQLRVVLEHMGFPWTETTAFICMKHKNFYSGMAGWQRMPTRYYATNIRMFGDFVGFHKLMYGTEFPINEPLEGISVFRRINEFNRRYGLPDMSEEDLENVLGNNAARVFRL